MSAALRRFGFEVTTELDSDRVELTEALRAFTRRSAGADVSLVFDAGHGIEMDGVNYLVPVDARLERDVDVRFETVTVDDLLVSTTGASLRLLTLPERGLGGGETLVVYCGGGGDDGGRRAAPEQPLHGGVGSRTWRRPWKLVCCFAGSEHRCRRRPTVSSVCTVPLLVDERYLTRTLAAGAAVTMSEAVPADPALADPHDRSGKPTSPNCPLRLGTNWPRPASPRRRPHLALRYEGGRRCATGPGADIVFGKGKNAMKAHVWSWLVVSVSLWSAAAAGAQPRVGAVAIDARQGDQYGWAVDYETVAAAQAAALLECGAGCSVVLTFGRCGAYAADQNADSTAVGWAESYASAAGARAALCPHSGLDKSASAV